MGPSEEEVLNCLTSQGRTPINYCFLWHEVTCSWDPAQGVVLVHRIEDNLLFAACQRYLRSRGATMPFPTPGVEPELAMKLRALDEIARYAECQKWPNLEALGRYLDAWRKHHEDSASSP